MTHHTQTTDISHTNNRHTTRRQQTHHTQTKDTSHTDNRHITHVFLLHPSLGAPAAIPTDTMTHHTQTQSHHTQ